MLAILSRWRHPERSRSLVDLRLQPEAREARDLARAGCTFSSREIPRPAGESAGLRDDAPQAIGFKRRHDRNP